MGRGNVGLVIGVLLLDQGLEIHHGVQLLRGIAQKALQVAHEPVHVPANSGDIRGRMDDLMSLLTDSTLAG